MEIQPHELSELRASRPSYYFVGRVYREFGGEVSMSKPSARPWYVARLYPTEVVLSNMMHEPLPQTEANAAHIVKCVNMHDELVSAAKVLRNEVRGILSAHEIAIRYDAGNSNWECLEIALKQIEALLAKAKADE